MKRVLLALFALVVAGFVFSSHLNASQTWVFTGSLTQPRYDHHAFVLADGRVFVAGEFDTGFSGSTTPLPSAFYDPSTGAWSTGPVPAQAHQTSISVRLSDGRILIAGGRHGAVSSAGTEIFDPITNTWQVAGSMFRGRVLGTLTLLPNGRVLAAGGYTNEAGFDLTAEVFDPITNIWTQTGSMADARWQHTATLLDDGRVLVAGGERYGAPGGDDLNSVEIYDPATGAWSPAAPMGTHRGGHRAANLPNGKVIVIGGTTGAPVFYDASATTEIFDPATGSWSPAAPMANGRANASPIVSMPDGTLLAVGGQISLSPPVNTASVERYNPATGTWSMLPAMNTPRQRHTATVLANGDVLAVGGSTGVVNLSSVERLVTSVPVTTALVSPRPNAAGWNKTDVTVSLDATVAAGAVQSISYLVTGPQSFGSTVVGAHANVPVTAEGSTVIQFHASDNGGGVESDQSITVKIDKTAPFLNIPNGITVTGSGGGAVVNFSAGGFDNGSGVISTTIEPLASGQFFPIGTTHETVTVTDVAGNTSVGGFDVIVLPGDTTPPTVNLTLGAPANANGWHKFQPSVQLNAFDNSGLVQSIAYTLTGAQSGTFQSPGGFASFNIFNQGVTTIAYHATDPAGNISADQFFTVRYDSQQPLIDPISNITVNATSSLGAVVTYVVNATDATSGIDTITTSKASGTTFPHGTTTVNVTATDKAGNSRTTSFTVTVNKVLQSIAVQPNSVTINPGQGQFFQAQGTFTDGTQLILPTSANNGGNTTVSSFWNVHFDDALILSQCGVSSSFSSQAFSGSPTVDTLWGPSNSVVHATGTRSATQVSLNLSCVNGQGAQGSLTADWTGTRYEGTWHFSGTSGHVTVRGWSPHTAAPTARFAIGAATVDGVIYVMGRDNPGLPSPVEAYDIPTDSWSTVSVMPTSREGAAYAALNGRIYAAGGHIAGGQATATMDVYDPSSNTWSTAASMSTARAEFVLVAAPNGKLYAIGGENGGGGSTSSVEAYDPATGNWTPQPSMLSPRKFHVAGAIGSTIVVAGGSGSGTSTTEVFDVSANTWSNGPSPQFNLEGGSAVVINGAMFVVGGTSNNGSSRVQMYRPAGQSLAGWALPGDMPTGRGQLAVAALGGNSEVLYAIGGQRNGAAVSTVEAMSTPPPSDLTVSSGGGGGGGGFTPPVVTFTSSNTSVATINNGQAQGTGLGQTTIVATAAGISCQATGTCATLTVQAPVNQECATVKLTVTPVGSIPFSALPTNLEGEGAFDVPFGVNQFDVAAGTYILHFNPPAGYEATPNPLTVTASCNATAHYEVIVEALDTTPPALTLPANISTYATSPLGANVSFATTAVDAVDGPRPVTCAPASGSLFPVGVTTVQCGATDAHGNSATGSFTVTVLSAGQMVGELIGEIDNFQQGAEILNNVLKSLNNGSTGAACNQLGAFTNQVQAQAGKKLTQAEATQLLQVANAAKAALGCP